MPLIAINIKFHHRTTNFTLYQGNRKGRKPERNKKKKKKKKNSIPTGRKNHVTFDKGHRWPQLFHGIPGTWLAVSWMLVPSQEAVHDEITGARYEHTSERVYTGEGRREGRRFTKNDNVIVPCLLVIGPSMPPPLRSRMNFQGNRLGRGLVVCTLNRLGCTYTFEHAVASATLRLEQTWENYGPASANLLARE